MQSFLNCYLRETEYYEWTTAPDSSVEEGKRILRLPLTRQKLAVYVPVQYWSLTGRHLFDFPISYRAEGYDDDHTLDYVTMTSLLVKEWLLGHGQEFSEDELVLRVLLSCQKMKDYVSERVGDRQSLVEEEFTYIEAEQSLLFGHLMHPTPKSKQGLTDAEDRMYSPEHKGRFQLHYFSADPELVDQDFSLDCSAAELIYEDAAQGQDAEKLEAEWKQGRYLIPMHPLQVKAVLQEEEVQRLLTSGALKNVGPAGLFFTATSSFRTLYSEDSRFMYKFSIPVKITNSLRTNQPKELARGVEVTRLLDTELGHELKARYPQFHIMKDPAFINLKSSKEVSGFEVALRENPFYQNSQQSSLVAGLVQDHAYGGKSRLYSLIQGISNREGRTVEAVSLDWFRQYLTICLDPILWLFTTYGIAPEAHQQNSVVRLENGYPKEFYYRDNQGYYFSRSKEEQLKALLPSLNEKSDTICADEVAEERLRYYFFFNHLFGLINGFGVSGLIEEERLMDHLRLRLKEYLPSPLIQSLLEESKLPCKANLLTRLYDMDELVGPMEAQSVYTAVDNPLAVKAGVRV
ncbi:IucA/IucC family protein [Halobacillus sp. B29]|uniref:IucA/IucC family protein n=1 Tax=Halobacillus sp. B29 TaxID=3457432 RepID=UPI003FCCCCB3